MIINKTHHPITIFLPDGSQKEFLPELPAARIQTIANPKIGEADGIEIVKTIYGDVENLPEPAQETWYIVPALVSLALPDRADLIRPDTGPDCLRDKNGKILAVKRFTQ